MSWLWNIFVLLSCKLMLMQMYNITGFFFCIIFSRHIYVWCFKVSNSVFCIYIVGHLVCLFYKYLWHVGVLFSVLLCHNICVASFNFFSNMGVPLCVLHLHGGPFGVHFLYKYLWQYGVLFSVLLHQNVCVASFLFVLKYCSSFAFPIHKI